LSDKLEFAAKEKLEIISGTAPRYHPPSAKLRVGPGQWYMIVYGLEDKTNSIQSLDGVRACDGAYFHYGSGSNGLMTVGGNCATK